MLTAQDTLDQIEFRPATEADVEALVGLYEEFFHFSDLPDLGLTFSRQNAAQWALRVIANGHCPHILAFNRETGDLVGSIGYMIDTSAAEPFAFIDKFYVRAGWRLTAIGRVLLELATDAARADGAVAFRAGLSAGAPYSKNLFLKMGFHETPGSVLMARETLTMCMGGSGDGGSKQMIQMQKDEAAEARAKEAARQGRINQGLTRIRQAFEGAPVMGSRKTYKAPATTYTDVTSPGRTSYGSSDRYGNQKKITTPGRTTRKATTTPGGYVNERYDTGKRSGGIGDDFFSNFKQAILDYYSPQVAEQYDEAKKQTEYGFARAGTLRSSAANTAAAKLAKDKTLRDAEVLSKADTGAGDLRGRVAGERAKAESQLYATENPDVAANQALAAISNITAEEPTLTPLGSLFEVATTGGANFLKGAANTRLGNAYVPGYGTSGRNQKVV